MTDLKTFAAASAAARKAADQLRAKLAELRQAIADRKRALAETEAAALPIEAAMERAQRWVMEQAATYRCDAAAAFLYADAPLSHVALIPPNPTTAQVTAAHCVTNPEGVLAAIEAALLDAQHKAALVLTAAERDERLKSLRDEIFRLEVTEEEIIAAAEAAGFEIARRADADPRAVLSVPDASAAA